MSLSDLLHKLKAPVQLSATAMSSPHKGFKLFFSVCDPKQRAFVITAEGTTIAQAWESGAKKTRQKVSREKLKPQWLKVDWVEEVKPYTWLSLREELRRHKRNYYRFGLALDEALEFSFLEQELNSNATLYLGGKTAHADLNEKNFSRFAEQRYGKKVPLNFDDHTPVYRLRHQGIFCATDEEPHLLYGVSRNAGRRIVETLDQNHVIRMIETSSDYLAGQVKKSGRFNYGWFPCFDRAINTYNTLRHASSTYAMLEGWEVTQDEKLKSAIQRALNHLNDKLIKTYTLPDGDEAAFLTDLNDEIKLGGNAVCILAFSKYTELMQEEQFLPLIEKLALGIRYMQNPENGSFVHVLNSTDLSTKEDFRTIYYEGEAAFGLMRLYGITKDPRWLAVVEKAFDHFIADNYWEAHDHWLSYCVNELTLYKPEARYFQFGIQNVAGHLQFVQERITTFPTLLELMMAAHKMIGRLKTLDEHKHLLDQLDLEKFDQALQHRAQYLMNGYFWPEYAMYFKNPKKIVGSCYIRHHAFRVRIDDVEHYLSGYVAYLHYYLKKNTQPDPTEIPDEHVATIQNETDRTKISVTNDKSATDNPTTTIAKELPGTCDLPQDKRRYQSGPNWSSARLIQATRGQWLTAPHPQWRATGLSIHAPTFQAGQIVILRPEGDKRFLSAEQILRLPFQPQAVICQDTPKEGLFGNIPLLKVESIDRSILDIGRFSRTQMLGKVIAITGSSGKTTCVSLLSHLLSIYGKTGQTRHNANLPRGIAWNLASEAWDAEYAVLELAIGSMQQNARMTRPDIAVFTNVAPAHLEYHKDTATIAERKSLIFSGMSEGGIAVINRDMDEWPIVEAAARKQQLNIISVGEHTESDLRLISFCPETGQLSAKFKSQPAFTLTLEQKSLHMALNLLYCLGVISALHLNILPAAAAANTFRPVEGRGKESIMPRDGGHAMLIDDAYNANPLSMKAALNSFSHQKVKGKKWLVLGDMKELSHKSLEHHRQLLPDILQAKADQTCLIGDDMSALLPELTAENINAQAFGNNSDLEKHLADNIQAGDLVLFKASHSVGLQGVINRLTQKGNVSA